MGRIRLDRPEISFFGTGAGKAAVERTRLSLLFKIYIFDNSLAIFFNGKETGNKNQNGKHMLTETSVYSEFG